MGVFVCVRVCAFVSVCVCVCARACVCARVLENGRNVLSDACLSQGFVGMACHVFILKMESREEIEALNQNVFHCVPEQLNAFIAIWAH